MSDPPCPTPPVEYPYVPLKTWLGDGDLEARHENGDAYITSHFWTTEVHELETFGGSVIGDASQDGLRTFINRKAGIWSDKPETRKARWLEVVGPVGEMGGPRPAYIQTLCEYMGVPGVALDNCTTNGRPETSDRIAEYGHVTHVTLTLEKLFHILIFNTNDIVTITHATCSGTNFEISEDEPGAASVGHPLGTFDFGQAADRDTPRTSPNAWAGVNAAIVLGRAMTAMIKQVDPQFDMPAMLGWFLWTDAEDQVLSVRQQVRHMERDVEQLNSLCYWLLDRRGLMNKQTRNWLEVDIRVRLERISVWCLEISLVVKEACEIVEFQFGKNRSQRAQEANAIATKQAHSAVVLNRILATLTILTLVCLPFTMTASFYSMDANASSPQQFGTIVGSATGGLTVIVVVLIAIFRYGTEIRDMILNAFFKNRDTAGQAMKVSETEYFRQMTLSRDGSRASNKSGSLRRRFPMTGSVKSADVEQGVEAGGFSVHEMQNIGV